MRKNGSIFCFTFRYIDDVLSLTNSKFDGYIDLIYPIKLGIKDTKETEKSVSYRHLHLEIESKDGLPTKLYVKKGDFDFRIVYFPFMPSKFPALYV